MGPANGAGRWSLPLLPCLIQWQVMSYELLNCFCCYRPGSLSVLPALDDLVRGLGLRLAPVCLVGWVPKKGARSAKTFAAASPAPDTSTPQQLTQRGRVGPSPRAPRWRLYYKALLTLFWMGMAPASPVV